MPQYQGIWTLAQAAQLQSTQRWATDPLFENTTLLLQADNAANGAQNNTFLDSSSNNFTITRNGNTTQGTFTPYSLQPGAWGNYFPSTSGSYLTVANNAAFTLGQTFTIECWIYRTSTNDGTIVGRWYVGDASGWLFHIYSTGRLSFGMGTGSYSNTSNSTLPVNTWTHVAVSNDATSKRLYINGVLDGTFSPDNITLLGSLNLTICQNSGGGTGWPGYISNLRIVKGTALYTGNFTPSSTPLTAVANTVLLTCQSNRFVDNSTNNFTLTVTGTPSVQAFSPFAPQYQYTPSVTGGSGYFDGSGDYLNLAAQSFTGDFTVEAWIYPTRLSDSGGSGQIFSYDVINIQFATDNVGNLFYYNNSITTSAATVISLNSWQHVALCRSGSTTRIFVNGTLRATNASDSGTRAFSAIGQFASGGAYLFQGYMSSVRWAATAVYTSNFTPPTAPLTAITNTQLLLNFTNAGIYDGTLKNNLETVGNAQVSTSVVKYGTGSMAFDGTGDYLKGNQATSNLYVLEGDFTIEMWVYSGSFVDVGGAYPTMYATSTFSGTGIGVKIQSAGGSGVSGCACVWYNGSQILTGTTNIANSTWTHVAVSRINGFMRLFVNGTQQASTTNTATFTVSSGYPLIGADTTSTGTLNGYIDDLRVTKGVARYTANFIPPSVALPRQ